MKVLLVISSLTVFVVSGLYYFRDERSAQWQSHQRAYRAALSGLGTSAGRKESQSFDIKLRQLYLPQLKRVDRCISCHVAMEDPRFRKHANPLKTHPGDYLERHPPEKFGCTICHDGQGRATVRKDACAPGHIPHWPKPLLPKPFLEANCYRCHSGTLKQTPTYNQGLALFERSGCLGCHRRDGQGGYLGTEFRHIADAPIQVKRPTSKHRKRLLKWLSGDLNLAYIYEAVRYPTAQPTDSVMMDYRLNHQDALALTVYLKSLGARVPEARRSPTAHAPALTIAALGRQTYRRYCVACHGVGGKGGVKNPNYHKGTMPILNKLAEKMFIFEKEDAEVIVAAIAKHNDLKDAAPQHKIRRFKAIQTQYRAIYKLISNGNKAGKRNPKGPPPFNMPAWRKSISSREINAVIGYIIMLFQYDDEEDED